MKQLTLARITCAAIWLLCCGLQIAQADVKISDLPAGTTLSGTEAMPAVQSGATVKTTPAAVNTYVQSQTTSTTIIGKFSSCTGVKYLAADGTCRNLPVGTVTSVAATVPSGFSVASSPITSSGTLAISGVLNPVAGGTGAATLSGVLKGNGTSAIGTAASSDVISLWSGTCSSGTFLRGDGSCVAAGGSSFGSGWNWTADASSLLFSFPTAMGTWLEVDDNSQLFMGGLDVIDLSSNDTLNLFASNSLSLTANTDSAVTVNSKTICLNDGTNCSVLNASNLSSGTVPDARFPATLPALNGSALTNLSASNLSSGTVPDARFPATLPALNGSALTSLNASNISSGAVPVANGGTGNAFFTVSGPATSAKTFTFPNASATVLTSNAAVTVPQGGTGLSSLAQGDLLYASASNTISALAKNTSATRYLSNTGASNAPAWAQIALTTGVTGTLPVGNGGSGTTSLSGVLKGNGSSAIGSAASSDVVSLWSGSCNSGTFLRGDGSCQAPSSSVSFPLSAPNGSSSAPSYSFSSSSSSGLFYDIGYAGPYLKGGNVSFEHGPSGQTTFLESGSQYMAGTSLGLKVGSASGGTSGFMGPGTINVSSGYYVNGVAAGGGPKVASAEITNNGICSVSNTSHVSGASHSATGICMVSFDFGYFGLATPVCTVSGNYMSGVTIAMISGASSTSVQTVSADTSGSTVDRDLYLVCTAP